MGPMGRLQTTNFFEVNENKDYKHQTLFQEFLEYPSRCPLPQWLNRQFPLRNALKIDYMILGLFMSIQNSFDNRVPRCGHV